MDGIDAGAYAQTAIALDDSEVCVLPYARLEPVATDAGALQRYLHRMMSHELGRQHRMMILLATAHAEERVAAFLVDMSERYAARGRSGSEFSLPMLRGDVASYLGLKLETVSRIFSRLKESTVIETRSRSVRILDRHRLHVLAGRALARCSAADRAGQDGADARHGTAPCPRPRGQRDKDKRSGSSSKSCNRSAWPSRTITGHEEPLRRLSAVSADGHARRASPPVSSRIRRRSRG